MARNKYPMLLLIALLFLSACANIKAPMGGPEDTDAPVLKKSLPENNSTNYKGKTVVMEFDEYVDGTKLNENMVISPLVDGQYEIITKKKTVTIKFREPFKENTTYNINLGESIKDVTKGTFIKNLSIAFSTGPFIDSLSIYGNAYDFVKEKPVKDLSILVYKSKDTNNVRNSKPLYFSRTDVQGNFSIHNVKEGTYDIFAINDLNKNFKYDNEKEEIGYQKNVEVNKDVDNIRLGVTRSDTTGPKIVSQKQEYEYYLLSTDEGLEKYSLQSPITNVLSVLDENSKTLRVFDNFNSKDSISLYAEFTDSSGNVSRDTIKLLFEPYKEKNKKNIFMLSAEPKNLSLAKNETILLQFNKPISKINYSLIKLRKDSTYFPIDSSQFKPDSSQQTIKINLSYPINDSLVYNFEKGAFIALNGDSSQTTKFKFRNKKEEDYGIIAGAIQCAAPDYIFQLINNKGKILDSKKNATSFNYKMLEPGEYQLKIIIDENKNGRWDPVNLDKNIPPEKIYYYRDKINLRANWEMLDLKFEIK